MIEKLKQIFNFNKAADDEKPSVEERIEEAFNSLGEDVLKIEFGTDISEFADLVLMRIDAVREDVKNESGFIFPPVHVLEKSDLQENEVVFYVRGKEVLHDFIVPNEETVEKFIYESLFDILRDYVDEIFTMEYVEKYITKVQQTNSWLVWSISTQFRAYEIKTILVNLIKEKKSIADINRVFEKIDECLSENRDCYHIWKPEVVARRISKEI
ncbi:MAG: FHIPEP family type III secretion protein [Candidatus Gastranaerophilales bacterium]|nr:FHIPEP family type III secretion protein [Candidatus Gastranaerophilales bacterium]MCM1072541.1 FHIPEP family type III secretion protein [Bacteroides sp.]